MFSYDFSFFFDNIKFQIVSAAVLIILEISYFRRIRLPILSSKIFTCLMVFSAIYMIFDFLTVYAIVYMEKVSPIFLRLSHQIFVFSINTIMLCLFLYVSIADRNQKRFNKWINILIFGLYFISLIFIAFGKIQYYRGPDGIYSFGSMPYTIFVIATIYGTLTLIRTIYEIINNKDSFIKKKSLFIISTLVLWFAIEILQFLFPTLLISNIGISLLVLIMYLGLEQPASYIDKISDSFNSHAFKSILNEYINSKKNFSIVTIEIENLLSVESEYDSQTFDNLIRQFSSHLKNRTHNPIYRISDSAFSIIFLENKKTTYAKVKEFLSSIQHDYEQAWIINNSKIKTDMFCSVIRYPKDSFMFKSINEILHFISKFKMYSEETSFIRTVDEKLISNVKRQNTIIRIIEDAIKNNGIEMFLQPIYNIEEETFSNAEALVRLKDNKTIGFISPDEFIPLAEKNGLITNLSDCIFNQTFSFMSENNLDSLGVKHIEVNLSAIQSVDPDLPSYIEDLINSKRLHPQSINLEITESTAISTNSLLMQNMKAIKNLGCSFSMDDFGTGYSNLSQIAKIDYELIKLDKSLLWPCFDEKNPDKEEAKIILENMISMILKLGKKIVVEGVETEEQFNYLKSLNVNYIQGYYFSKPLPMKDYLEFIKKNNS